jgi:glycosyltransferase involved in cell wall biosynthesis
MLGMPIDVSVVIPTFRRPQQLSESILSALGQHGVTLEVVVVDDSPEGSAAAVVEAIGDPRVTYLRNLHPSGGVPSLVRNLGWPLTSGRILHFLDDDDVVMDGHYAAVKDAFERRPETGLLFGRIEPFGSGPTTQLQHEKTYFARAARKAAKSNRFGPRWAFTAHMLFDMALLVCSASVVRRECVVALGGFDPAIRLMEDADFHVRVIREYGAHFLDRTAIRYRIGSPSLMHTPNPPPEQLAQELAGRRAMQTKYRTQRGSLEFYLLAFATRGLLRFL